jgi:hypothetical protein
MAVYQFIFKAEAQFSTAIELNDNQYEKIKKLIGDKNMLLNGNKKDASLIKFFMAGTEYDIFIPTDIEEIETHKLKPL